MWITRQIIKQLVTSSLVTWRRQRASLKRILGMHMCNRDCMSFINNFLKSCNESIKHIRLTWPLCEGIRKVMKLDASAFLTHAHFSFDKSQQHCSILQIDLYLISQKHCGIGHCSGHHSPFQHLVLKRWNIQKQHPCRESLRETGKNWIDPYRPRSFKTLEWFSASYWTILLASILLSLIFCARRHASLRHSTS